MTSLPLARRPAPALCTQLQQIVNEAAQDRLCPLIGDVIDDLEFEVVFLLDSDADISGADVWTLVVDPVDQLNDPTLYGPIDDNGRGVVIEGLPAIRKAVHQLGMAAALAREAGATAGAPAS